MGWNLHIVKFVYILLLIGRTTESVYVSGQSMMDLIAPMPTLCTKYSGNL